MRIALDSAGVELVDTAELGDPQPNPYTWPVCDVCHTPYVLRRCWSFSDNLKAKWAWMKDCAKPRSTCKQAGVEMHDAAGEVPTGGR